MPKPTAPAKHSVPPAPSKSETSAPAKPAAPAKPSAPPPPSPQGQSDATAKVMSPPGNADSGIAASAHPAEEAGRRSASTRPAEGAGQWLGQGEQRCAGEASEQEAKQCGSHAAAELFRSRTLAEGSAGKSTLLPFKAAPTQSRPYLPAQPCEPPYKAVPANPTLLQSSKDHRHVLQAGEKKPKLPEENWATELLKPLLQFLGLAEELRGQNSLHCCQRLAERFNKEVMQLAEQLSSGDRELARLFQTVVSQHMGSAQAHEVRSTPSPILMKYLCFCLPYDSCAAVLTREDMMLKRVMISPEPVLAGAMLYVAKVRTANWSAAHSQRCSTQANALQ